MNIDALLEDYMNNPKWAGKIFMQDEKTCYMDGLIAGAKEMQEMMISCNEKIDDLRRVNKKLKTKLENTERKIWEISQKCYEVEDIESIISDLNNLSMELEE